MEGNNITQKVYFDDDNNIVVESDHGTISKGEDHVDLKGDFIIRAEDVAKLLASHYKLNIQETNLLFGNNFTYRIIGSHDIASMVDKQEESLRKARKQSAEWESKYKEAESIANNLDKNITAFNASRRFYERKLKVKDLRPFSVFNPLNWQK